MPRRLAQQLPPKRLVGFLLAEALRLWADRDVEIVVIPAATFAMGGQSGNPSTEPARNARIPRAFYLGRYE